MDQSGKSSKYETEVLKTSHEVSLISTWAGLPNLVLTKVFGMLNRKDRRNASGVCRNWRANYFQPRFFGSVTFSIQPINLDKSKFFNNTFGSNVRDAYIVLYSLTGKCVKEFINLLKQLSKNNNLKTISIRIFESTSEMCSSQIEASYDDLAEVVNLLKLVLSRISKLNMSCVEDLFLSAETVINLSTIACTQVAHVIADQNRYQTLYEFGLWQIVADKSCIILHGSKCTIAVSEAVGTRKGSSVIDIFYNMDEKRR